MADRDVALQFAGGSLQSLSGATSTGAGTSYDLRAGYTSFAVQCATTGSTSVEVNLQGSLDDANWVNLGSTALYTSTAAAITASTSSVPVKYVRLNVVALSTGESLDGWIGVA